jgi:hypothetical protein
MPSRKSCRFEELYLLSRRNCRGRVKQKTLDGGSLIAPRMVLGKEFQ